MCETWANENGNQKLAHDSFNALDKLYNHESTALETQLWSNKKTPAVCKIFQDDQKAFQRRGDGWKSRISYRRQRSWKTPIVRGKSSDLPLCGTM